MTKNQYEPAVATIHQPHGKDIPGIRTNTNKRPSTASKQQSIAVTDTNTLQCLFPKQKRIKSVPFVQNGKISHQNLQSSPRGSQRHRLQQQYHRQATKTSSLNYQTCGKEAKQPSREAHSQNLTTTHRSLDHDHCVAGKNRNQAQRKNFW